LKAVLGQERERERLEREKRRAEREEAMEVDGAVVAGDDVPSCEWACRNFANGLAEHYGLDLSIEAPPSVLPQRRYCDITGLEVRESSES
jgi:INO80 complex subunit C